MVLNGKACLRIRFNYPLFCKNKIIYTHIIILGT